MGKNKRNFLRRCFKQGGLSRKKCGRFLLRFLLAFIALTVLLRFIPIPFSAYMAQQKIAHLFSLDFAYDVRPTSRLSCQIRMREELAGLVLITPERQA